MPTTTMGGAADRTAELVREDVRWAVALGAFDRPLTDTELAATLDRARGWSEDPAAVAQRAVRIALVDRDRAFRYRYDMAVGDRAYGELFERHQRVAGGLLDGLDYDIEGEDTEQARLTLTLGETTVSGQFDSRGSSVDPAIFDLVNEVVASTASGRRFEWVVTDAHSVVGFLTPVRAAAIRVYLDDRTRKLPPAAAESWDALLDHLDVEDPRTRQIVAEVLDEALTAASELPISTDEVVSALRAQHSVDQSPPVRQSCLDTLCSLATDSDAAARAVVTALDADSPALASEAFEAVHTDYGYREDVLPPADPDVRAAIEDALVRPNPALRAAAAELAVAYDVDLSPESLLDGAPAATDAGAEPLLRVFGDLEAEVATEYVTAALTDGETTELRVTAAEALRAIETTAARDALVAALSADDRAVRETACEALSQCEKGMDPVEPPGDGVPPVLATQFEGDEPSPSAAAAVGHLDTTEAIDMLCQAATSSDRVTAVEATAWLSNRPVDEAIPTLADIVRSNPDDEMLCSFALHGLAQSTHPEANRTFEMAEQHETIEVPRHVERTWAEHRSGWVYTVLGWAIDIFHELLFAVALALLFLLYPLISVLAVVDYVFWADIDGPPLDRWDVGRLLLSLCIWAGIGYLALGTP